MMETVYLSHDSALAYWRAWSAEQGISVREFHNRNSRKTDDLPFRTFPTTSTLAGAVGTKTGIQAALRRSSLPLMTAECPLNVLGPRKPGARSSRTVIYHHSSMRYPKGSFLRVADGVYVCAPELVFAQMADSLTFGALLALGYELCGCYPIGEGSGRVCRPLTTPNRLAAFVAQLRGLRGAKKARVVARQVKAKSASPAETRLSALVATSRVHGGLGFTGVKLNEVISLNPVAQRIAHASALVGDAVWPDVGVVFEYDSATHHGCAPQIARDSRRRSALGANGLVTRSITKEQMSNVLEFQETVLQTFREAGIYAKRMGPKQLDRHMRLRHELWGAAKRAGR